MSFNIPLFELNFDEAEEKAVAETIRSKWLSTGPKTLEFENSFSNAMEVKHAVALSNCTVALHLALKIIGIKEEDEIICPSLTFVATANAIKYLNAKPVFCDITDYTDLTIDPDQIKKSITKKTRAILVMHYGGFACNMDEIVKIAQDENLKIIEDACHGPLSEYKGKKLGTIGDIGCFSFFSNKNMTTAEGGMLVTDDENIFSKAKLLRSHGMTSLSFDRARGHSTTYDVVDLGFNYRMDDIRASIGIEQLKKLPSDLEKRTIKRKHYLKLLGSINEIVIPFKSYKEFSSNYIFPIILKNSNSLKRDEIRKNLMNAGIQTSVHYPAVHRFSIYKEFSRSLPITEYVADNLITLPMYSSLTFEQIDYIADKLKQFLV